VVTAFTFLRWAHFAIGLLGALNGVRHNTTARRLLGATDGSQMARVLARSDTVELWSRAFEVIDMVIYSTAIINAQYVLGAYYRTGDNATSADNGMYFV